MGDGIKDTLTADGKKFQEMLKELAGLEVRIGFQRGDGGSDDGVDICDIAAWNELGTDTIPSRPFLRDSVDGNEGKINDFLQGMKKDLLDGAAARQVLNDIGIFQKDLVQEKIIEGSFKKNAKRTTEKKKSDKPLVDTGRMRQSVNYVIGKKGSD